MTASAEKILKCAVLAFCFAFLAGCGYRFSGAGELPGDFDRLAIETFKNRSGEIGIESIITNEITYEFTRTAKTAVVNLKEADAILSGIIKSVRSSTISHITTHKSAERRITVTVDAKLVNTSGKVLWSANGISASEEYSVSGDKLAKEQNKKSAIAKLSGRLAQRIYYRITDDF